MIDGAHVAVNQLFSDACACRGCYDTPNRANGGNRFLRWALHGEGASGAVRRSIATALLRGSASCSRAVRYAMQKCDCFIWCKCLRILGASIALLVFGLYAVSYYAVVVLTLWPIVSGAELAHEERHSHAQSPSAARWWGAALLFTMSQVVTFMGLWSYVQSVRIDPGRVPADWDPLAGAQADGLSQRVLHRLSGAEGDSPALPTWCRKCNRWRPARAHHCSVLGACILKYDHYCIWVNNTVGLLNYKHFILFMAWTWAALAIACLVLVPWALAAILDWERAVSGETSPRDASAKWMSVVVDASLFVAVGALLGVHLRMAWTNVTTVEYPDDYPGRWPFDRGGPENMRGVFGGDWRLWTVPVVPASERRRMLAEALEPFITDRERAPRRAARPQNLAAGAADVASEDAALLAQENV
ncbi:unnamed protein product [Pedinophyceae sp. YPF-701]|nr:unnamed protein product [Pedinophyceae sp. YPF-701]